MRLITLLLLAFALFACATPQTKRPDVDDALVAREEAKQREIALRALVDDHRRMHDVGYPLLIDAAPLCGEMTMYRMGWVVTNKYDLPEGMRDAGHKLYELGDYLTILHVVPGSAVAEAGIQNGDVLVRWNGKSLPADREALKTFVEYEDEFLFNVRTTQRVTVSRGDETLDFEFAPDFGCDYQLVLVGSDEVNAFANGTHVGITRGMIRFVEDDIELATVVGHEIAHNAMEHLKARKRNSILGFLMDLFAAYHGINTQGSFQIAAAYEFSPAFEAEADYVGLYVLAVAGEDYSKAPDFWRRMAALHPGSIERAHATSHPATPERFIALEATVKEIDAKKAAGEPLKPELK